MGLTPANWRAYARAITRPGLVVCLLAQLGASASCANGSERSARSNPQRDATKAQNPPAQPPTPAKSPPAETNPPRASTRVALDPPTATQDVRSSTLAAVPVENDREGADTATPVKSKLEQSPGSPGCGTADPKLELTGSIRVRGQQRGYELHLPANYDPQRHYPLIYAWHGFGKTGAKAKIRFGLVPVVGNDAIIVYPDALPIGRQGETGWVFAPKGRDFALFDALHQKLRSSACIDDSRVYSTGWSHGGIMTNALACYRADVLTAVAPVAGAKEFEGGRCSGSVAVMGVHGAKDEFVKIARGRAAREFWRGRARCKTRSNPIENSVCVAYDGCRRPLLWCEHPDGHPWPKFGASHIWQFFSNPENPVMPPPPAPRRRKP